MRYARTREADLLTPTAQCTNILAGKKKKNTTIKRSSTVNEV